MAREWPPRPDLLLKWAPLSAESDIGVGLLLRADGSVDASLGYMRREYVDALVAERGYTFEETPPIHHDGRLRP